MIEINLLPDEFRKKETVKLMLPEIPLLKILPIVVAVFMALLLIFVLVAVVQWVQFSAVTAEMAGLSKQHAEMIKQKNETTETAKKLQQLETMAGRKFFWWSLMNALSDSVTKGIWLRELAVVEMTPPAVAAPKTSAANSVKPPPPTKAWFLKLDGSTVAQGQETAYVGKFIKELKDNKALSGLFEGVELADMNQRKIREYDVYDFVLLCKFKKELMGKS